MKPIQQLIWLCLMCVFLLQTTVQPAHAAPPPEYVEQMKAEAPLLLIGTVESYTKLRNSQIGEGSEERKATLRVQEIKRKPDTLALAIGDTVDFYYTYIPPDVAMAGPAPVNIVQGDQIQIWLKTGDEGWIPAVSGNTVDLLKSGGPRPEPTPRDTSSWISENEYIVMLAAALILLWLIRRSTPRRANS